MKRFFPFVCAMIVLVPICGAIQIPLTDIWYSQYVALFTFLFLGVSIFIWRYDKPLSLFTVVALFSTVITARQHPRAILCLFQLDFICALTCIISQFTKSQRRKILGSLMALWVVQFIWVILQTLNIDPFFYLIGHPTLDDPVGFSASHNQIGLFFAGTAPIIAGFIPYLLPLTFAGLIKSTTAISVVAAIVSLFLYYSFMNKKILLVGLIVTPVILGTYFVKFDKISYAKFYERFVVSYYSVDNVENEMMVIKKDDKLFNIKTNKWLGYGLGSWMRFMPWNQYQYLHLHPAFSHLYEHAHNDYAEVYFEMGRFGFISLFVLLSNFIFQFIKANKTKLLIILFCSITAYLICALAIYTVQTAVSGMVLAVIYGLYRGELRDGKSSCLG